ncbi:hypothetical protein ACP4OV_004367 [Aristida adscensionis]
MGRLAVAAAVAAWAIPAAALVDYIVPEPYMDEIFHVPQAQQYCRGDFLTWDPMITTPPGLYYFSLAYVASLFSGAWMIGLVETFDALCSTAVLRSTNILLAMVCGVLFHDLLLCIHPGIGKSKATIYSILVSLYPVHWFFTFLYYTDVASLAAVLATYLFCLKKRFWVSALFGAVSILFRQTNVIWIVFFAANGAVSYVQDLHLKDTVSHENNKLTHKLNKVVCDCDNKSTAQGLRRRRTNDPVSKQEVVRESIKVYSSLMEEILDISIKLWKSKFKLLIAFTPFAVVMVSFIAFVIWNGGIVLGAKEAHMVSLHFAQLLYFAIVSAAALLPWHFTRSQALDLLYWSGKNKLAVWMALGLSCTAVHFFSIAHPYLLADNRHYTFYVWRKIIQINWMMKYILVPLYLYSWFSIIKILGRSQTRVWVLSFVFSVGLVLVPAPLVEFRYYTIPFIILVLHSPVLGHAELLALGSIYAVIDLVTLAMFLFRPFHWEHEPGTQRFMW